MRFKTFLIFIAFTLFCVVANAQCNGTYKISATYNSDGNKIETNVALPKISISTLNVMGLRQVSVTTYSFTGTMMGNVVYEYSGYNNGWYIYVFKGMGVGTNYVYCHESGNIVRITIAGSGGNFNEYTK